MEVKFNPAKHLYSRGWLGLVPLVGGIVGIVLIFLGITKYRDKKLILIGIAALSFTVIIYGYTYNYEKYDPRARKKYAADAQSRMAILIQSIEFYKVQHGHYPDSLVQLLADDRFAKILDFVTLSPWSKHKFFCYKKLNDHYYLFSAGFDKIPFTSDDILPTENFFDTGRNGLIKPVQ